MKKTVLIIAFALITIGLAAQRFEGGIAGGLNFTQLDGDRLAGYNKIGLNGGFWVKFPFSKKWAAGLEFLYMQKGAVRTRSEDTVIYTLAYDKFRINYIEVPLYAEYTYRKVFTFQAGITGAYRINAKTFDFTGARNYTTNIKAFEAGLLLGATYALDRAARWQVQVRWQYSVASIAKGDTRTIFKDNAFSRRIIGLYNNLLSVSLKHRL